MEALVGFLVQVVAGVVGSGIAGKMMRSAPALLPKLLAGAVGGLAGGALLASLFGGPVNPVAATDPTSGDLDVASLLIQAVGGLVGGGALTWILGAVMGGARR